MATRVNSTWAMVLVPALVMTTGRPCRADDRTSAEDLFQLGQAAFDQGDLARACSYFDASLKADFALGTLLNLAFCHERRGLVATAWAEYRMLEDRARRAAPPQEERASFAAERAAALRGRLPRIRIEVGSPPDDLAVHIDGTATARELWPVGAPVDPGQHVVVASAPGRSDWSETVDVTAEGQTVVVVVPVLAPTEGARPVRHDEGPAAGGVSRRTAGFAIGGAGLGAVALGGVFGLLAMSAADDATCPAPCYRTELDGTPSQALRRAEDAHDRASAFATVSTIGFAIGLAGLAVGVYLVATGGTPKATRATDVRTWPSIAPALLGRGGGILFGGAL